MAADIALVLSMSMAPLSMAFLLGDLLPTLASAQRFSHITLLQPFQVALLQLFAISSMLKRLECISSLHIDHPIRIRAARGFP